MTQAGRQCKSTGLQFVEQQVTGYRVAKSTYGGLNPPKRLADTDRMSWGRYDTLGSTVYLAADPAAAFHEVMAPFALDLGAKNPLQKDADALGISLKTLMQEIAHDWDEKNYMNTGCLPAQWSYDRKLYTISMTHPLPWVDVQHPNSIGAIRQAIGSDLAKETGITSLTLNELTSPQSRSYHSHR